MKNLFNLEKIATNWQPANTSKRPFVFVHGNTQNDSCGSGLIQFFQQRDHSTLSYDLPGHGNSPLQNENYTFSDLIDLNFAILQKYSIENPILCGHSLGGMIQAGTIARYLIDNCSLILCGSYDSNPVESALSQQQNSHAQEIDEALQQYIEEGFELFTEQKKYDYFAHRSLSDIQAGIINRRYTNPQANANNLNSLSGFNVRAKISELALPILVLHGEQEDVIPPALIKTMAQHYTNIRICWYPELGHYAFYQNPQLTEQYLNFHYDLVNLSAN